MNNPLIVVNTITGEQIFKSNPVDDGYDQYLKGKC
jgi:hypothetical protein